MWVFKYEEELKKWINRIEHIQNQSGNTGTVVEFISFWCQIYNLVPQHQTAVDQMSQTESCTSNIDINETHTRKSALSGRKQYYIVN